MIDISSYKDVITRNSFNISNLSPRGLCMINKQEEIITINIKVKWTIMNNKLLTAGSL